MAITTNMALMQNASYIPTPMLFPFEVYDHDETIYWMNRNWVYFLLLLPVYFLTIFGLQEYMRHRKRFEVRTALIVWNLGLSLFSTVAFFRLLPETIYCLREFGFEYSVCVSSYIEENGVTGFWMHAYAWSKLVELGDTVFVVLRKHKLIFLHVYHHVTMYIITVAMALYYPAVCRYVWINCGIHGVMYGYYALRAMNFKVPKFFNMCLTTMQITQMFVGSFLGLSSYRFQMKTGNCRVHLSLNFLVVFSILSFAVLFLNYFVQTYVKRGGKKIVKQN